MLAFVALASCVFAQELDSPITGLITFETKAYAALDRDALALPTRDGLFVVTVLPGTEASEKIKAGQIIIAVDDVVVKSYKDLLQIVRDNNDGTLEVQAIQREGSSWLPPERVLIKMATMRQVISSNLVSSTAADSKSVIVSHAATPQSESDVSLSYIKTKTGTKTLMMRVCCRNTDWLLAESVEIICGKSRARVSLSPEQWTRSRIESEAVEVGYTAIEDEVSTFLSEATLFPIVELRISGEKGLNHRFLSPDEKARMIPVLASYKDTVKNHNKKTKKK